MKPPAWRREREIYPVITKLEPRYHDVDGLGHINNIAQAAYFDEARFRFSQLVFDRIGQRPRIVTADSRVSYLAEVFYPAQVEIGTGIVRTGSSSYELGQAMFQNGDCVALCMTIFVHAPGGAGQPLPGEMRSILQELLIRVPEGVAG